MKRFTPFAATCLAGLLLSSSAIAQSPAYDTLIAGGTIYDGLGGEGRIGDVAIKGDRIVYVGPKAPGTARTRVDEGGGRGAVGGL